MTYPCQVSTRVIRKLNPTRSLAAAAFITILIAWLAVAVAGQTAVTASGKEPVADTARGSANFLLSPTPVITGPLIFLPPETYPEGNSNLDSGFPSAIADVNGDGKLDLVVINSNTTVIVLLGNGDGSFQAPQSYSTGLAVAEGITIADLNGDGKPDLVLTGCGPGCDVAVLLGNGDGSFKTAMLYRTAGSVGQSVAVADVNLDGKPDLVVVDWCTTSYSCTAYTVGVMLGKGDGTFEPVVSYSTGGFEPSEVTIADVNGDGNPDLLVANGCNPKGCTTYDQNHEVGVLLGRGDGTFQSVVGYASGGFRANSITAIDLNGDGKLDLVVGNQCLPAGCASSPYTSVGVLFGNGDGTFQAPTSYETGAWSAAPTSRVIVADVNGDGKLDLIMSGFCNENSTDCGDADLFALLGNGNGTFQPGAILSMLGAYGGPEKLLVGDLNDDGNPDLVVVHGCNSFNCPSNDVEVGVMLNNKGAPATTISLTSSRNPIPLFTTVTYTAKVAGGSGGTLSGTVTFADGDVPAKTVTLSANQAKYSTTYKIAGNHLMTATYSGVFHSDEGSRSVILTETAVDPTTTALATSGSPTFVGQPVTFTATVTSTYGAIPNGELVKFYDGSTLLASVALSGGKATYTTSKLTAKTHGMKAVYVGDSMFATSTGYVSQVVKLYSTTTTLTCSPNPSSLGQVVSMTATVKSSGPVTPTGKVTFTDGTTWIGTGILSGGVATITKSNLAVGTHAIKATYNGDSNSATSTSAVVNQVVN